MSTINVMYQFDNKYAPFAGISLFSLLENNKNHFINIFFASMDVSVENIKKIEEMCKKYHTVTYWIDTMQAQQNIEELSLGKWNGSYAAWLKVFLINDIPEDVKRILYLDCDTLVEDDLEELFFMDLEGKPVAAVYDCLGESQCVRIGCERYYNAGVTLYDLDGIRKSNTSGQMFSHLQENKHRYALNDQDFLNDYFREKIVTLPLRYNMQGFLCMYKADNYLKVYQSDYFYSKDEIEEAKKNPCIIHFFRIFGDYPWEKGNIHACRERYRYWKENSLWKSMDDLTSGGGLIFRIEKMLYRCLSQIFFLHIFRRVTERKIYLNI